MKEYTFWIRQNGCYRKIAIEAESEQEAINQIPACESWKFAVA